MPLGAARMLMFAGAGASRRSLDLEFGSSQYASGGNVLNLQENVTIECWVKLESAPTEGVYRAFVSKWNGADGRKQWLFVYTMSGGVMEIGFWSTVDGVTNQIRSVATTLTVGTWHHVAVVYTFSAPVAGQAQFFKDGVSVGTSTLGGAMVSSTADFRVGATHTPGMYYDGLIAEVRVWDVPRSAAQVNDNKAVVLAAQAGLRGYWRLDNNYSDLSGSALTLTPSGSPVFSPDVPF